jgi:hypothetical protein
MTCDWPVDIPRINGSQSYPYGLGEISSQSNQFTCAPSWPVTSKSPNSLRSALHVSALSTRLVDNRAAATFLARVLRGFAASAGDARAAIQQRWSPAADG